MKILLTHPFCWPHVRRGGERFFHEWSIYLANRGHEVTLLTSVPGPPRVERDGNRTIYRERQVSNPLLERLGVRRETLFAWTCFRFLRRHQFDVVGCLHYSDGWAAACARQRGENPCVVHIAGLPFGKWLRRAPWETWIMSRAARRADSVVVPSREAARRLEHYFHKHGDVVWPPCDLSAFPLRRGRDLCNPRILAVGAFSESRKGGAVLIDAFAIVKQNLPGAMLQYSGDVPRDLQRKLLARVPGEITKAIEFLGIGNVGDLPALYGQAAVTVLPSVEEAFGMALVESLACGTPVVGSNTGGIPDIIENGVGFLFDPGRSRHHPANPEGLAEAILRAIELHGDPALHERCRRSAERFSWKIIGPQFEAIYEAAANRPPQERAAVRKREVQAIR